MAFGSANMRSLVGKVAIVTASTKGLGLAIARRLGQDGAKVMISSRKQANVEKAVADLKSEKLDVEGIECHVGKADHRDRLIQETVSQFGGIDILVSNAATKPANGSLLDIESSTWDKVFDTNLKSSFFLCKEIVPHMEMRGGGSVLFVSSVAGFIPMDPRFHKIGAYAVSKTALGSLTKALVPHLSSKNIRVNCVAPGVFKTEFSEFWNNPDVVNNMIAMKRYGETKEIGGLVSFLSSDDASYITGENIMISGGISVGM